MMGKYNNESDSGNTKKQNSSVKNNKDIENKDIYKKYANLYPEDDFEFKTKKAVFEPEITDIKNIVISVVLNIILFVLMFVIIFQLFFLGKYYFDEYRNERTEKQAKIIYEYIVS